MHKQSKLKDALAAILIYGGLSVAKQGIFSAAVATGIWTRSMSHGATMATMKTIAEQENKAWRHYKQSGKIGEAIGKLFYD
jgi:hypothetical protein